MNCVIISTKHGTYQITNDSLETTDKFFNGADTTAPEEFIANLFENKGLEKNYVVKKWSGTNWDDHNIPVGEFLTSLNKDLEEDIANDIYGWDDKITSVSFQELADHLIGNRMISDTNYGKNLWYNKGMGASSMYAFSKSRGVVMTGTFNDNVHGFWFKLYEELKAEQTSNLKQKPISTIVNSLINGDFDIYEKLTILVNNNQQQLIKSIGNRYIKNAQLTSGGKETKKVLRENSNEYSGGVLSINNIPYVIPQNASKNAENDTITLLNVLTNELEIVDIKTVASNVYMPTEVVKGRTTYYYIKNKWFKYKNKKFEPVEDSKTISELYTTLSATTKDIIILSGRPLRQSLMFNEENKFDIFATCPLKTKIQVNNTWYIKGENGWSDNKGNVLKGPSYVYAIQFPQVESEYDNKKILWAKQQLLPAQELYTKDIVKNALETAYGDIAEDDNGTLPTFVFNELQKQSAVLKATETGDILLSISTKPATMQSPMYLIDIVKACVFLGKVRTDVDFANVVAERMSKHNTVQAIYKEFDSEGITGYRNIKSDLTWNDLYTKEQKLLEQIDSSETENLARSIDLQKIIDRMKVSGAWSEFCEIGK